MGHQHSKSPLSITISTSQSQSDQLFDFHKTPLKQDQKVLKDTSFLVGFGETVKLVDTHFLQSGPESTPDFAIFKISQEPYQQIRITALGDYFNRFLWKVINQGEVYPLKTGQWLKIGKVQMQLKRIVYDKPQREALSSSSREQLTGQEMQIKSARSQKSTSNPNCRICFQPYTLKRDPLVCLCKCTGSIQYTHFQCLRDWITSGFQKRQEQHFKYYSYGDISCELCKSKIPLNFTNEGEDYTFFQMNSDVPFAEFQSVTVQNGKVKFARYMIELGKHQQVTIGRSNSCQVTMKDISISRVHCSLELKHGLLLVRDKKSKFGTLARMEDSLQFTSQSGLQFQFGSHLIQLHKKHFLKCCCFNFDSYKLIYEDKTKLKPLYERYHSNTQGESFHQNTASNQNEEQNVSLMNFSMLRTRFVRGENL